MIESNLDSINKSNVISNIAQAKGAEGLLGGMIYGIEEDENGNLSFNPTKFVIGFLGGMGAKKGLSMAWQIGKTKYYERNFNKFIKDVNANKPQKPRFEVTKELEKKYRENEVVPDDRLYKALNLKGKIFADYIKLAQKHPEYFANPAEAKVLTEYILQHPKTAIPATKQSYELIFSELKGGKGALALDLEYKGGKYRVRSVHLMTNYQYKQKLSNNKKQGGPTLQF